ncbi:hippocampus abundant transcript 1 protein isoform X1 [Notolabrus celidotus]|uniref:hippocampus abundant transcript 1 protein isoform X1 n=1 Tax=Notolabrus celidotus TaxID=1203425 RepID=UPI0014905D08|nr:hippocampus abundant transcript 1 protein isoform X1 [Notolabrus celidotus]
MPGEPPAGTGRVVLVKKIIMKDGSALQQGIGRPSVYHAVVVIFLEFFAWGLLTTPMLTVLHETFPQHTFLINGLIQGVKGLLSFMSAPLIGALSDVWGRRTFLLVTVFFTCAPIPLMRLSPWYDSLFTTILNCRSLDPQIRERETIYCVSVFVFFSSSCRWYFAMISMSGAFSVTFSVIFAYVADVTDERERSTAYGLVSATFAASLVTSPAIGAYLSAWYGDNLVVLVATLIALADICFILLAVPESLPDKMRLNTWGAPISWEQADPFASLRKVGQDPTVLLICITVFLSYLPEAGQYSSFFLYLRQVINFSSTTLAVFIGVVGILSIVAQTLFLTLLMRTLGNKNTVLLGLGFQILQLAWYGFGSEPWMMWAAGAVAAMSSITFPAVSALVSQSADPDKQGVVQGMITGIRGLCNGLGPALYGFVFFLFNVELNAMDPIQGDFSIDPLPMSNPTERALIPGPPFLLGACTVVVAFLVALFIPEKPTCSSSSSHLSLSDKPRPDSKESMSSLAGVHINTPLPGSDEETPPTASDEDFEPLLQDSIV